MPSRKIKILAPFLLGGMLVIHASIGWRLGELVAAGYPDFTSFYSAGEMVRKGMGHNLYDLTTEWRIQQEVAGKVSTRMTALPYLHAPYEALLFVPFSLCSYTMAYLLWNLVSLIILFAVRLLLKPHFALLEACSPLLWICICLAFFPVFFTMLQGQDSILLLLIYGLVFVAVKKESWFWAGCWLALGLFRSHLIMPFLLVMLLLRKWRLLVGFLFCSLGLAALSATVVGWRGVFRYPFYLWYLERAQGRVILPPRDNPNLRGLISDVLSPWTHRPLLIVIALSAVGVLWAATKWSRASESKDHGLDLGFSLTLVTILLVSYHVFLYDFTLLLIPILVVLNYFFINQAQPSSTRLILLAPLVLLFFTPLYLFVWLRWQQANLLALVLLLWAWGLSRQIFVVARSDGRPKTAPVFG